jgi:PHD/YefM family antitoxin component YafN of YafNO toxin-antitoxin module
MNIKPSAAIRKNYNEISKMCKSSGEPIYLTKNGEGDLVVMDIESFTKRESMLKLREHLISVEEDRLNGKEGKSIDEVISMMEKTVNEVTNGK